MKGISQFQQGKPRHLTDISAPCVNPAEGWVCKRLFPLFPGRYIPQKPFPVVVMGDDFIVFFTAIDK